MKKQELVHVHSLLGEVANYRIEEGAAIDLEEYDQLGTRPTSIHLRKAEHLEAVFELAEAINSGAESEPVERVSPEPASAD